MTTPSVDAFLATPAAKKAAKRLATLAKKAQVAKAMQGAAQAEMDRMLRDYMEANGVARDAEKWRPTPPPAGWLQRKAGPREGAGLFYESRRPCSLRRRVW